MVFLIKRDIKLLEVILMQWLFLIPEECWIILITGAGICFMLGFRKVALSVISSVILLALLSPFIESVIAAVFDCLNTPTLILVMIILMVAFGLWIIEFIFGKGAKDHFSGEMLSKTVIFILTLPFKIIWRIVNIGRRV